VTDPITICPGCTAEIATSRLAQHRAGDRCQALTTRRARFAAGEVIVPTPWGEHLQAAGVDLVRDVTGYQLGMRGRRAKLLWGHWAAAQHRDVVRLAGDTSLTPETRRRVLALRLSHPDAFQACLALHKLGAEPAAISRLAREAAQSEKKA
jgi:hypothetical protein